MKKIAVLSFGFLLASLSFAVPIYVDVSYSSTDYGVVPGSEWVLYLSQSGYEVPSDTPFNVQEGVTNAAGLPLNNGKGAVTLSRGTFEAGPDGSVYAFAELDAPSRQLRTFPDAILRVYSSTNLAEGFETGWSLTGPVPVGSGLTIGSELSDVPLANSTQYAPAPPSGVSGYISPVVQSLTAVPGSHISLIVSVAVGFVVLLGAYLGIRLLSRSPRSVGGGK